VRDGVHRHRVHHEQREAVAERDQPERRRAQRLARGEVSGGFGFFERSTSLGNFNGHTVHDFPMLVGAVADHQRERQADRDGEDARGERGGAPAEAGERLRHQRHHDAAERQADRHRRERAGALALEPVDERHVEREEAAQARAERDHDERAVKSGQRLHQAEQAQAGAEHHHAGAHEHPGAEAVDEPAEHRTEQRDLHLLQRRRARQRGLAPALLVGEHRQVGAEGLRHQPGLQELQAGGRAHHPPAVEDAFSQPIDTQASSKRPAPMLPGSKISRSAIHLNDSSYTSRV
jgi:hypothetical protein